MREASALPVAVLDTSVLVPRWSRLTLQALAHGPDRRYQPVWSEWIIGETWRVLTDRLARSGVARSVIAAQANEMMRHLLPVMQLVSVATLPANAPSSPLTDPNDAPVWATALVAQAHFVVSHNTAHFPAPIHEEVAIEGRRYVLERHRHTGVEFLTAVEFIQDVLGEDPAAILGEPVPQHGLVRSRRTTRPA